jgi:hypothetical protein
MFLRCLLLGSALASFAFADLVVPSERLERTVPSVLSGDDATLHRDALALPEQVRDGMGPAFAKPPAKPADSYYYEIYLDAYRITPTETDYQFAYYVRWPNPGLIGVRGRARVVSHRRVPIGNGQESKYPADGWIEFWRDPPAYQSPTDLPPVQQTMPTTALDFPSADAYAALVDRHDDLRLETRLKVRPFLENFCRFKNQAQIERARALIRQIEAINSEWERVLETGSLPAMLSTFPKLREKEIKLRRSDADFFAAWLGLIDLAAHSYGHVHATPPNGVAPEKDSGTGFYFDEAAAAAEYRQLAARVEEIKRQQDALQ